GTVGIGHVVGDEVGIVVPDDLVVGGDDEARRRIEGEGHLLVGDEALPFGAAVPAGHRHQTLMAGGADGDAGGRLVADVAGGVGVDEVDARGVPVGQRAV